MDIAERHQSQKTGIDVQNDTGSEITNLCIDRLSRLTDDSNTIDTALSVLKAFFPIVAAFIFFQKDDEYTITNSIGSPSLKDSTSFKLQKHLATSVWSGDYEAFAAADLGFDFFPANSNALAYPLHSDTKGAPKSILVLITEKDKIIPREAITKVIHDCKMKFLPKNNIRKSITETKNEKKSVLTEITKACVDFGGKAQILVLELSENSMNVAKDSIYSTLSHLVGKSARLIGIEPSRLLIILKEGIDRELYSHQLIKSAQSNLNLGVGQIKLIHSSDILDPRSIHELIPTIKKGV